MLLVRELLRIIIGKKCDLMTEKDGKPWCLCDPGIGPHDEDCPAALRYREQTEKYTIREAAILAVHHLEAQYADPSVEQYVDAVLSVIPTDKT